MADTAEVKITVTLTTGEVVEHADLLSAEDGGRLMASLFRNHGRKEDGSFRTPAEMIEAFWSEIRTRTFHQILKEETEIAQQQAAAAIQPMKVVDG